MEYTGILKKMRIEYIDKAKYYLDFLDNSLAVNDLIEKKINFRLTGNIFCLGCSRETQKSFHQGYCFSCFKTLPETAPCILNPELCEAHLGYWRNKEWAEEHCLKPHVVYLAYSGNLKVGVTRISQIPTRWLDQGASLAVPVCQTPNRYEAGLIEVFLKNYFSDKTSWQKMLKSECFEDIDLQSEKAKIPDLLKPEMKTYFLENNELFRFSYPVLKYPEKVSSFNIEKETEINETLVGIKGQYLIFESGKVINIRRFGGYEFILSVD